MFGLSVFIDKLLCFHALQLTSILLLNFQNVCFSFKKHRVCNSWGNTHRRERSYWTNKVRKTERACSMHFLYVAFYALLTAAYFIFSVCLSCVGNILEIILFYSTENAMLWPLRPLNSPRLKIWKMKKLHSPANVCIQFHLIVSQTCNNAINFFVF